MMIYFLLLVGGLLYLIVQYRVTRITRTPWWLLWLVLMTPAFVIAGWSLVYGDETPMPLVLMLGCSLICLVVYSLLVRLNPKSDPPESKATDAASPPSGQSRPLPHRSGPMNQLSQGEKNQLRTCFPWSTFYLQEVDYKPQAVICRGQLRSQPEDAYRTIVDNIKTQFGDRFLVIFQLGLQNQPFFALVPNPNAKHRQRRQVIFRPVLAVGLLVATALTTVLSGATLAEPDVKWSLQNLGQYPGALQQGLLFAIAMLLIFGSRGLGQYFMAWRYKIRASLPYFIPTPFTFGTIGAFVHLRSPMPHRKALFDVGLVGPLASFLVALPFLIGGLAQSTPVALPSDPGEWTPTLFNPSASLFFALLSKAVLQADLTAGQGIHLHPLAMAGGAGLIFTAIHLMPVGQLDGGHIVHAMFGQRNGAMIGQIARLLFLGLAVIELVNSRHGILLVWAFVLWLMSAVDEPALNDVSELDNGRDFLGLLVLALLLMMILPVPHWITPWLFPTA